MRNPAADQRPPTRLEVALGSERASLVILLILFPLVCWSWIVVMARDMYGPMTGASAWMMTLHWDARHVLLLWAMVVKLLRDADDDPVAFRIVSLLLVAASALYIVPQIYGLEAADQVDWLDAHVGLGWVPGALSAANPDEATVNSFAWPILELSLILFALTGAALFVRFLLRLGRPSDAEAAASEA